MCVEVGGGGEGLEEHYRFNTIMSSNLPSSAQNRFPIATIVAPSITNTLDAFIFFSVSGQPPLDIIERYTE